MKAMLFICLFFYLHSTCIDVNVYKTGIKRLINLIIVINNIYGIVDRCLACSEK